MLIRRLLYSSITGFLLIAPRPAKRNWKKCEALFCFQNTILRIAWKGAISHSPIKNLIVAVLFRKQNNTFTSSTLTIRKVPVKI